VSGPVAVLGGTGKEGFGLALRWARAGEPVIIGSRDIKRAREAANKITQIVGVNANISGMENIAAAEAADVIVLTVPFEGHITLLKQIKPVIAPGSIVVDTTVPLASSVGDRATRMLGVWQGSAAQQTAELVPEGIAVVAAFHNVSSELLHGEGNVDCDVIVCSDDPDAAETIRMLAVKIPGVRAIYGGKLENARIVEQITALLISLNIRHKAHSGIRITGLPELSYRI
jgi:8-hydroxy-5-deazaflavin:NADPH oxidoreductase